MRREAAVVAAAKGRRVRRVTEISTTAITKHRRGRRRAFKALKALLASQNYGRLPVSAATYTNIAAPPSTAPPKKYCDITGLPAAYTDPRTRMRYWGVGGFAAARAMPEWRVDEFLALRGANTQLK